MGSDTTTIQISVKTWQELNGRKQPGESFNDVIQRLLQNAESRDTTAAIEPQSQQQSEARETGESEFSVPDTVPDRIDKEAARDAINAAVQFVQEQNGATMREIVPAVGDEHDLGYDVPMSIPEGERYRGSWWRKIVKPGLENHPDIQKPARGQSEWRPQS